MAIFPDLRLLSVFFLASADPSAFLFAFALALILSLVDCLAAF